MDNRRFIPSIVFHAITTMPSILQPAKGDVKLQINGDEDRNGSVAGKTIGHTDEYPDDDAFQHLPKPQQDVLLLHGPRQKYSLQTTGQIPGLRSAREVLVQVSNCFRYASEVLTTEGPGNWLESR